MASVDWKKLKTVGEIKAKIRHDEKECRLTDDHENEHINKELTPYNLQTCGYEEACSNLDKRIAYLDNQPNANKRKDRTCAIGLEIPIPNKIPDDKVKEYVNKVNEIIKKMFGAENFIASFTHVDEIHDYIDSETGEQRTSMRHIHIIVLPVKDNKLNCNAVYRKGNCNKLNNAIHEMTLKDYGVKFMDGSKKKSRDEVETLKNKSLMLENENLTAENSQISNDCEYLKHTRKRLRADIALKQSELAQIQTEIKQRQSNVAELQRQLQVVQEQLQALQKEKAEYSAFRRWRREQRERIQKQTAAAEASYNAGDRGELEQLTKGRSL